MTETFNNRVNYKIIAEIIEKNASVLDLGCASGELLSLLKKEKNVAGKGIEIAQSSVIEALEKGLSIIQGNIDEGLSDFQDKEYDYVVLNQTLQSTNKPAFVIDEMLRVGKKVIVSFPNFAFWKVRLYLLLKGEMPKSSALPFEWHDTPNIHLLTINDFFRFCEKNSIIIDKSVFLSAKTKSIMNIPTVFANWLCDEAIFIISR